MPETENLSATPSTITQPATEAPAKSAEGDQGFASKFAALARKEKALRSEAQKIKAERDQWLQEQQSYKTNYIPKERLTKETLQVLNEVGMSPNQLAQMLLEGPPQQDPVIAKIMARLDEIDGRSKKVETDLTEKEKKDREQALNNIRNEAKMLVDSDSEYETIKALGETEAVVRHIEQTYDEEGVFLTVQEAAKEVEEALVDRATKLFGVNKIKSKFQPQPEPPKQEAVKPQETKQPQQTIKTLTHDMVSSSANSKLNEKDRIKRAIMVAQGLDPDTGRPRVS